MLSSLASIRSYAATQLDTTADAGLTAALEAASDWIQKDGSRIYETATYTETLDGDEAGGSSRELLLLDRGHRPASSITSVTENGVALTVASGYSTTAAVIVKNLNKERGAILIRQPSAPSGLALPGAALGWAPGFQNITVVKVAGYASNAIPDAIEQTCNELAWLMFRANKAVGVASSSKAGHSTQWEKRLSPTARRALDFYRAW